MSASPMMFQEPGKILEKLTDDPWAEQARKVPRREDALIWVGILLATKGDWVLDVGREHKIEVRDSMRGDERTLAVMYQHSHEIVFEAQYTADGLEYLVFVPGLWEDTVRIIAETLREDESSWEPFEVFDE